MQTGFYKETKWRKTLSTWRKVCRGSAFYRVRALYDKECKGLSDSSSFTRSWKSPWLLSLKMIQPRSTYFSSFSIAFFVFYASAGEETTRSEDIDWQPSCCGLRYKTEHETSDPFDRLSCAFANVTVRFHLTWMSFACACACIASENQALLNLYDGFFKDECYNKMGVNY